MDVGLKISAKQRLALQASGLALAVLATRVPWLPTAPDDHDAANFWRALTHFDLAAHSPHLPGYPVYIALARLAQACGAPSAAALAWPNVLTSVAAAVAIALTVPRVGWLAAVAYAALPGLWVADVAPRPDALAVHVLVVAACLLARARLRPLVAVLLGASLGIRASNWPVVVVLAAWLGVSAPVGRRGQLVGLVACAVAAWAIPLVVLAGGPRQLLDLTREFAAGHFRQWGNTALTPDTVGVAGRAAAWATHLLQFAAVGPLAVVLVLGWRQTPAALRWLLAAALAQGLWMLVGQNPEHPRHVLPIAGLVVLAAAWAALQHRLGSIILGAATLVTLAVGLARLPLLAQTGPDAALASYLRAMPAENMAFVGGSEVGVVRVLAPAVRAVRLTDPARLPEALAPGGHWPLRVFASSRALVVPDPQQWQVVAQFVARPGVDAPHASLILYQRVPNAREVAVWR